jgi:O-antigen/teichoic acid export membrane protein
MLAPGLLFLLAALADYLASQGSIALVQSQLGGAELAHYSTHRTFVNIGRMVSAILATAVWPELTAMEARGESAGLIRAHRTFCKLNGWVAGALVLALTPISGAIYSAWTLRTLALDTEALLFLVGQSVLWGFWTCGTTVLAATNRQGRLVAILLSNAIVGLISAYLLLPSLGFRGAALGGLIGDLLVAVWLVPTTACRALGDRIGGFASEILPAVFGLLWPFGAFAILAQLLPWPEIRGPVVACGGLGASAFIMWHQLTVSEREAGQRIIARVRQRFRSKIAATALGGNT